MVIDISRKNNKAMVLRALYNAAKAGTGPMDHLFYRREDMTVEEAEQIWERTVELGQYYFDHFIGRIMKVDLSGDCVETAVYDMNNGSGAGARAIASVPDKIP